MTVPPIAGYQELAISQPQLFDATRGFKTHLVTMTAVDIGLGRLAKAVAQRRVVPNTLCIMMMTHDFTQDEMICARCGLLDKTVQAERHEVLNGFLEDFRAVIAAYRTCISIMGETSIDTTGKFIGTGMIRKISDLCDNLDIKANRQQQALESFMKLS